MYMNLQSTLVYHLQLIDLYQKKDQLESLFFLYLYPCVWVSLNTQNFPFIMKRKKIAVEWRLHQERIPVARIVNQEKYCSMELSQ